MRIRAMVAGAVLVGALGASGMASAHQTYGTTASQNGFTCGKSSYQGLANPTNLGGTLYLDVRAVSQGGFLWSIWLYQESNNHAGMQTKKDDASPLDETNVENCTNSPDGLPGWGHSTLTKADTIIF